MLSNMLIEQIKKLRLGKGKSSPMWWPLRVGTGLKLSVNVVFTLETISYFHQMGLCETREGTLRRPLQRLSRPQWGKSREAHSRRGWGSSRSWAMQGLTGRTEGFTLILTEAETQRRVLRMAKARGWVGRSESGSALENGWKGSGNKWKQPPRRPSQVQVGCRGERAQAWRTGLHGSARQSGGKRK